MTWQSLLDDYLLYLRDSHYSRNTLSLLEAWLRRFRQHCEGLGVEAPGDATPEHVASFHKMLLWCPGRDGLYKPCTVDQGLRAVRGCYRWAVKHNRLLSDPCRTLILRRAPRDVPYLVTVDEVERMLEVPDLARPAGLRDRAVMETLYAAGLRRGECHGLELDDVNLRSQVLHVRRSKGGRHRMVPIGDKLTALLVRYLKEARPKLTSNPDEAAFFLSCAGTRFSIQSMGQLVNRTARKAGLPGFGTHVLRHAFATHLLEGGAELADIQRLLGHTHLESTHIYAHLTPQQLRKRWRRTHPRSSAS